MIHRHLNTTDWTLAAIDSALDRGDLADWRELFAAARADCDLAARIIEVATKHDLGGASALACVLVARSWPQLERPNSHPRRHTATQTTQKEQ